MISKQGVALTGRNRTGPPCSVDRPTTHAAGRPARRQRYRRRRQTPTTVTSLAPYTMCRRASNNIHLSDTTDIQSEN